MSDVQQDLPAQLDAPSRFVIRLNRVLALIMAVVLFSMMTLVTVDVFGRAIDTPIKGGFEIVQFMLAILIFLSLPLITWDSGHVTVSIFEGFFNRHFTRFQQMFVLLFSALSLVLITWRMWLQGEVLADGQQITGFLEWPIAPVAYAMSGLAAIACLIMFLLIAMALMGKTLPKSGPSAAD